MRVVVVRSCESEVVVVGRNWKSARRRLAHLLAEKLLEMLLIGPPVTAEGLWCFLGFDDGNGVVNGTQTPILRDSIGNVSFLFLRVVVTHYSIGPLV